jgi:hypothetical protein
LFWWLFMDKAHQRAMLMLVLIKDARARLAPSGVCHGCGEPLRQSNGVFCDDLCAADYIDDHHREDGE